LTEQEERDPTRDDQTPDETNDQGPDETNDQRPDEASAEVPSQAPDTPAAETEAPAMPAPEDVAPEEVAPEPETVEAAPPAEEPAAEEPGAAEPAAEESAAEEPAAAEQAQEEEEAAPAPRSVADLAADARYTATGKRKSSVARVILMPGTGQFRLNGRPLEVYFPRRTHQVVVQQPLETAGYVGAVDVIARIHGGGISGQADAVRHGIAKALIEADPALRGELKRRQLLTRDPRVKERRKAGLKKARKRPQFSKR
jgi:small subunit ribosomal protein S9